MRRTRARDRLACRDRRVCVVFAHRSLLAGGCCWLRVSHMRVSSLVARVDPRVPHASVLVRVSPLSPHWRCDRVRFEAFGHVRQLSVVDRLVRDWCAVVRCRDRDVRDRSWRRSQFAQSR